MINDLEIVQWDYLLDPAFQLVNTAGKPLTNGWIEVYIHGTRDKYYCASDFNGTLHPFKIPLDSLGSNIVLASPANAYDVYIYNVYGSLVMSRYNVKPGSGSGSGVIPADASYGIFGTNELPMNNTSNTGFQFTAKDIGGDDITFHEITYPYGRVDCKEGVYFYSATIEVSNTSTSNESVKFQVLAGKNPNQSVYWLDFDNTYLHKQLYTICGIANFVNEDTFRINVSPYQLTNGVKASASQVAIHKLSTVVEGEGGGGGHEYGAGWGILINNDEISVDPSIIPTIEYVDASVSAVSSTLISTIESVSGNLQDQIDNIPAQVQSDWNQTDDTAVDYIKNKPDLTVYATHDEVCAVSSVLQNEIDNIDMSEYVTHTELNETVTAVSSVLENEIQIVSAAIPDVSDFVTHDEVSAVSSNLVEYVDNSVNTASGNLVQYIDDNITEVNETIENVSGNIINEVNETINNVSGDLVEYIDNSVGAVSGDILEYVDNTVNNVSGVLETEIQIVSGAIPVVTGYATKDEVNTVSSTIINTIEVVSGAIQDTIESVSGILQDEIDNIPEQVNADWDAVSGKAEILNKPDLSVYATHDEVDNVSGVIVEYVDNSVTAVSSVLNDKIDAVSAAVPDAQIQSDWNQTDNTKKDYIKNKPDLSHFVTDDQLVDAVNTAVTSVSAVLETDIQVVSGALDDLTAVVASASGIEYGQFYSTGITATPATMARVKGTIAVNNGRIQLKKGSSYHVTVRGRYNQTTATNTNVAVGYIEYVSNNTINVNVDKTLTDSQYFEISYDLFNLSNDVDYLVWFTGTDGGTVNDLWIEIHSLNGLGVGQGGGTGPGVEYTAGYGIQILNNVISVSGIAPQVQSDWNAESGMAQILNKPEEQKLIPGSNITIAVSGVSAVISSVQSEGPQVQADWDAVSGASQILNRPDEYGLVAGDNIEISVSGNNIVIDSTASGDVTHADLEAVSGALETDIQTVSAAIPEDKLFIAIYNVTPFDDIKAAYAAGKAIYCRLSATRPELLPINTYSISSNSELSTIEFVYLNNWSPGVNTNNPISEYTTVTIFSCYSGGWRVYYNNLYKGTQGDWNETYTKSSNYIRNKPDLTVYATNAVVTAVSGTLHTEIQSVSSAIPEEMSLVAGDNIEIQVSGASAIISSTATVDITKAEVATVSGNLQDEIDAVSGKAVNADWTAVSGAAEILHKPNEYNLIAGTNVTITKEGNDVTISARGGGGGGSSYIAGTGIDITNDIISVSGVAMASAVDTVASAIDVVSGKLPTTEHGKFTIQNNVSGGPIEVICPTDQAPDVVFYQINSVSGNAYAPGESIGVINYYYGETPADFNGIDDVIQFTINDNISNIGIIAFYYTTDASGVGGPDLSTTKIVGDSTGGIVQSGTYKVKAKYNAAGTSRPYGKYLQIMFSWRNWASDAAQSLQWTQNALSKITFFGVVRSDPSLGVTVNLDRYALGNTSTISNTSGYTQATIYTDPITKKQSVYLPSRMPSNWREQVNVLLPYGTTTTPTSASYTYYGAYKEESGTSNMQYAVCVDHNWNNKIMTFIAFDKNGNAFEKWTYNWGTSPKTWTTETLDYATAAELQAVSGAIPEIELNSQSQVTAIDGHALAGGGGAVNNYVKVITDSAQTSQVTYGDLRALCEGHEEFDLFYDSTSKYRRYLYRCSRAYIDSTWCQVCFSTVPITDIHESTSELYGKQTNKVNDLEFIFWSVRDGGPSDDTVAYVGSNNLRPDGIINHGFAERSIQADWNETDSKAQTYIRNKPSIPEEINLIPGSGITIEVSGASAVISSTGGGGGSTYTAGNMIDITNNAISVETTAGITDIQLVNSIPASPTSTVLYLIPET